MAGGMKEKPLSAAWTVCESRRICITENAITLDFIRMVTLQIRVVTHASLNAKAVMTSIFGREPIRTPDTR